MAVGTETAARFKLLPAEMITGQIMKSHFFEESVPATEQNQSIVPPKRKRNKTRTKNTWGHQMVCQIKSGWQNGQSKIRK